MKKSFVMTLGLMLLALVIASANWKNDQGKNVETFSVSLSVADIQASKDFYEKLGFEQVPGAGGVNAKWMVMTNGAARIGLFQGFFPKNTITLNPKDARIIYKKATDSGLKAVYKLGMDKTEGPASFSMVDPDGNPVLIDQHK